MRAKPTSKQIAVARALAKADLGCKLDDQHLPSDTRKGPFEGEPVEMTRWRLYLNLARVAIRAADVFDKDVADSEKRRNMADDEKRRRRILELSRPGMPMF